MNYRKLPGTDVSVSRICLGTMNWGQQNTEADAHEQLEYATSRGVNFIDTAEVYPIPPDREKQGLTETFLGTWLKKTGKRDELVIASKVASARQAAAVLRTRDGSLGLTKRGIMEAIDGTLLRLQTDYVDLYQVHTAEREVNMQGKRWFDALGNEGIASIEETLDALAEVVASGKARYIGVSNETPWGVSEYVRISRERNLPRIITIQNQYSLLSRKFEIGLSEMCLHNGIGLLAYSALNMGALTGKYLDGARPAGARFTLFDRNKHYNPPHAQEAIRRYVELARESGLDPAQMALAFVNSRPFVTATIIGATAIEQLRTDIESDTIELSSDVLAGLAKIYTEYPDPTA